MATVAPSSDQAADLLQKLSLDSQTKTLLVPETTKRHSAAQYMPVDSGVNKQFDRSTTPSQQDFMDPNLFYQPQGYPASAYYYGGFDGSVTEWDYRYSNPDGVEVPPGIYGDSGALMYSHGYGYPSYDSSGSHIGHDTQLYGTQHYQYPTSYYQPSTTVSGPYTPSQAYTSQTEVSTSLPVDQVQLSAETAKGNQTHTGIVTMNGASMSRPIASRFPNQAILSNSSHGRGNIATGITSGYQDRRYDFGGIHSTNPWLDAYPKQTANAGISPSLTHGNNFHSGRNQNLMPHLMGLQHPRSTSGSGQPGFMNNMYANNRMYGQNATSFGSGTGFGPNNHDPIGRGWSVVDRKFKMKARGNVLFDYRNESVDGLNELNRGPRAKGSKDDKDSGNITIAAVGQSLSLTGNSKEGFPLLSREQYNSEDFPDTYAEAKFFVIKSYSEDDIHKSIKYGVWASTPNGNKKLDAAYKEAQEQSGGCPVFLLFSVNASGQFVGLAEMVGCVDFNKSMEYWQQDKWNGCFPVKWHIVKDVPNSLLRHITLENNENKPVTNSRDTQEVRLEQGIQVLKIFKGHLNKTCILDDLGFYERREKIMQEKKAMQRQLGKQVENEKPLLNSLTSDSKENEGSTVNMGKQKSVSIATPLSGDLAAAAATGELKAKGELSENKLVTAAEDAPIGPKPVADSYVVSNGIANAS